MMIREWQRQSGFPYKYEINKVHPTSVYLFFKPKRLRFNRVGRGNQSPLPLGEGQGEGIIAGSDLGVRPNFIE